MKVFYFRCCCKWNGCSLLALLRVPEPTHRFHDSRGGFPGLGIELRFLPGAGHTGGSQVLRPLRTTPSHSLGSEPVLPPSSPGTRISGVFPLVVTKSCSWPVIIALHCFLSQTFHLGFVHKGQKCCHRETLVCIWVGEKNTPHPGAGGTDSGVFTEVPVFM